MEASMVNRYPSEGYVRFLQTIALAAIVGVVWTLAENAKIREEKRPPICLVNQAGGIRVSECAPKAETTVEAAAPGE
jgi:hypothetical protein